MTTPFSKTPPVGADLGRLSSEVIAAVNAISPLKVVSAAHGAGNPAPIVFQATSALSVPEDAAADAAVAAHDPNATYPWYDAPVRRITSTGLLKSWNAVTQAWNDFTGGAQGPAGPAGSDGAPGADGAPGVDGQDGAPGTPGAPGAPGADGDDGAQGIQGIQGIQGVPGTPGQDGAQGDVGPQGIQGIQGIPGPPGGGGNTLYAPGSVSVATGNFQIHVKRLQLTGSQRLSLAGTARFRLSN